MAKKKLTLKGVWDDFLALNMNDQQEFVNALPPGLLLKNPWIMSYLIGSDMEVEIAKSKIPKKRGKPDRDSIIKRRAKEGFTPSQIARLPDVVAANGGVRMSRQNVQNALKKKS